MACLTASRSVVGGTLTMAVPLKRHEPDVDLRRGGCRGRPWPPPWPRRAGWGRRRSASIDSDVSMARMTVARSRGHLLLAGRAGEGRRPAGRAPSTRATAGRWRRQPGASGRRSEQVEVGEAHGVARGGAPGGRRRRRPARATTSEQPQPARGEEGQRRSSWPRCPGARPADAVAGGGRRSGRGRAASRGRCAAGGGRRRRRGCRRRWRPAARRRRPA